MSPSARTAARSFGLAATVDAVLMQTRCCVEVRLHFRPKKRWGENGFPRCGGCPAEGLNLIEVTSFGQRSRPLVMGSKESNCFPFEYKGPAFASRCKCCCPSFRTVQVATKPDGVANYVWYRDY